MKEYFLIPCIFLFLLLQLKTYSQDYWTPTSTVDAPSSRSYHSAVWTGTKMIIWGGYSGGSGGLNTGGVYDPANDTWTATSTSGAPASRYWHTAVWTGTKMIIWGGFSGGTYYNSGGLYDPSTNTWTATSTTNAPYNRRYHTAVWTGSRMIVWGGNNDEVYLGNSVYIYNPATNTWTTGVGGPSLRHHHTAVWAASGKMIIYGGVDGTTYFGNGGKYDTASNSWATFNLVPFNPRAYHTSVWTGSGMIIWGGYNNGQIYHDGGIFNPNNNYFDNITNVNSPTGRRNHTAVWAGDKMIIWGGNNTLTSYWSGAFYDTTSDSWLATTTTNAPNPRQYHTAVWTGSKMIVWGGEASADERANTGGVYTSIPAIPNLISPPNGSTGIPITPAVTWSSAELATTYRLQISMDSLFSSTVLDSSGITGTTINVPAGRLIYYTRYYWRVHAKNIFGSGNWSVKWNFTTLLLPPPAPTLILPPNGSTGQSLTPLLDWNDVSTAQNYRIQVSSDSLFGTTAWDTSGVVPSQVSVPPGKLINLTRYFWRVNAANVAGTGPWSVVWNFITVMYPPAAPILLLPVNGALGQSLTPLLDWNDVSTAQNYRIQISTDSLFGSMTWDTSGVAPSQVTVPSGKLANNTWYFWRVNASNAGGSGAWSAIWKFKTLYVGINANGTIPVVFRLYNAYPNPFNPVTKIKFDVPYNSDIKITVYDIMGKESAVLVNSRFAAGSYSIVWNAGNFSSGIYFYRIEADRFTDIKKIILLK